MDRRLAAILAADVVGYSRLMGEDEEGTLAALRALREDVVAPTIDAHRGRIVKLMGDGLLAEFSSVTEAVNCAVAIQRAIVARNTGGGERELRYRIGINLGDVIVEDQDIYGDGVNVAARLEGLAVPGGICISDTVHRSISTKIDLDFEDLGAQSVKNIAEPIHVYRILCEGADTDAAAEKRPLALPEKPSIAVLPFTNMSGDVEQEYFSDGITEDIITALSRLRWLFVIARNSTFHFKGTSPDIRQVASELGVRYVLEGSVRKAGNRVRITAQLIDARNGQHIWAERYDRELTDIFDLQDEITVSVAAHVDAELADSEREVARTKPTENLDAWDCYQRGMWHAYRFTDDDTVEALRLFHQTIQIDDQFAPAYAGISLSYFSNAFLTHSDEREAELDKAREAAKRSVECDDKDPQSHWVLGRAHLLAGEHDQAIEEFTEAVTLNPSYCHGFYNLGWALMQSGRPEEALVEVEKAYRLSPHDPLAFAFMIIKCQAFFLMDDLEQAWEWGERSTRQPNAHFLVFAIAMAVAARAGWDDRMEHMKAEVLRLRPDFRPDMYLLSHPYSNEQHRQLYLDAFAKAGIVN